MENIKDATQAIQHQQSHGLIPSSLGSVGGLQASIQSVVTHAVPLVTASLSNMIASTVPITPTNTPLMPTTATVVNVAPDEIVNNNEIPVVPLTSNLSINIANTDNNNNQNGSDTVLQASVVSESMESITTVTTATLSRDNSCVTAGVVSSSLQETISIPIHGTSFSGQPSVHQSPAVIVSASPIAESSLLYGSPLTATTQGIQPVQANPVPVSSSTSVVLPSAVTSVKPSAHRITKALARFVMGNDSLAGILQFIHV